MSSSLPEVALVVVEAESDARKGDGDFYGGGWFMGHEANEGQRNAKQVFVATFLWHPRYVVTWHQSHHKAELNTGYKVELDDPDAADLQFSNYGLRGRGEELLISL